MSANKKSPGTNWVTKLLLGIPALAIAIMMVAIAPPEHRVGFYAFAALCGLIALVALGKGRLRAFCGSAVGVVVLVAGIAYLAHALARDRASLGGALMFCLVFGLPGAAYAWITRFGFRSELYAPNDIEGAQARVDRRLSERPVAATTSATRRAMSPEERTMLEALLRDLPSAPDRIARSAGGFAMTWAMTMVAFVLLWKATGWFLGKVAGFEVGWTSEWAPWLLAIGGTATALFALGVTIRAHRRWTDPRPVLRADLDSGEVIEEHRRFTAAKAFVEPEHGAKLYLLRTDDERVFAAYDRFPLDDDDSPTTPALQPRRCLVLVRAPLTGYVLGRAWSGEPFESTEAIEMTAPPEDWPESDEFCKLAWDEAEHRLAGRPPL